MHRAGKFRSVLKSSGLVTGVVLSAVAAHSTANVAHRESVQQDLTQQEFSQQELTQKENGQVSTQSVSTPVPAFTMPTLSAPDLPGSQNSAIQMQWKPLAIQRQDLLFSNFQNSTNSAEIADPVTGYQMKLFALKTEATANYDDVVFTYNPAVTRYGATMSYDLSEPLQVSAGYIGSRSEQDVNMPWYEPSGYGANSWNMALNTRWLDNSITTHLEYAQSEYDANRFQDEDAYADQAMQAQLRLSSDGVFGAGWLDYWVGQFQYRSVGQHFYTAGNADNPKGRDLARFHFQTAAHGIGMEFEWQQECDIDDLRSTNLTPLIERSGVRLNYDLINLGYVEPLWHWLGSPSLTARYFKIGEIQEKRRIASQGFELENDSYERGLNLFFTYSRWHWSVDYKVTDQDKAKIPLYAPFYTHLVDQPSDLRHHQTELKLGWLPSDRLSMNLNANWYERSLLQEDSSYQSHNYGMEANINVLPSRLSLLMRYRYGFQIEELYDLDYRAQDTESWFGNAQLSWHAMKVMGRRPAMDVYVKSAYGRNLDDVLKTNQELWSAHIGVELYWTKKGL